MKKLTMAVLIILGVCINSYAAPTVLTNDLTLTWEHVATDYPLIASWALYWSDSPTTGFTQIFSIDHPDSNPLNLAKGSFTVTGEPGTTVRKYFYLTAWARNSSGETGPSNIIFYDFKIPAAVLGSPSNLTITVIIQPK